MKQTWHEEGPLKGIQDGDVLTVLPPARSGDEPLAKFKVEQVRQHAVEGKSSSPVKVTVVGRELRYYEQVSADRTRIVRNVRLGCQHGMPRPLGCVRCDRPEEAVGLVDKAELGDAAARAMAGAEIVSMEGPGTTNCPLCEKRVRLESGRLASHLRHGSFSTCERSDTPWP